MEEERKELETRIRDQMEDFLNRQIKERYNMIVVELEKTLKELGMAEKFLEYSKKVNTIVETTLGQEYLRDFMEMNFPPRTIRGSRISIENDPHKKKNIPIESNEKEGVVPPPREKPTESGSVLFEQSSPRELSKELHNFLSGLKQCDEEDIKLENQRITNLLKDVKKFPYGETRMMSEEEISMVSSYKVVKPIRKRSRKGDLNIPSMGNCVLVKDDIFVESAKINNTKKNILIKTESIKKELRTKTNEQIGDLRNIIGAETKNHVEKETKRSFDEWKEELQEKEKVRIGEFEKEVLTLKIQQTEEIKKCVEEGTKKQLVELKTKVEEDLKRKGDELERQKEERRKNIEDLKKKRIEETRKKVAEYRKNRIEEIKKRRERVAEKGKRRGTEKDRKAAEGVPEQVRNNMKVMIKRRNEYEKKCFEHGKYSTEDMLTKREELRQELLIDVNKDLELKKKEEDAFDCEYEYEGVDDYDTDEYDLDEYDDFFYDEDDEEDIDGYEWAINTDKQQKQKVKESTSEIKKDLKTTSTIKNASSSNREVKLCVTTVPPPAESLKNKFTKEVKKSVPNLKSKSFVDRISQSTGKRNLRSKSFVVRKYPPKNENKNDNKNKKMEEKTEESSLNDWKADPDRIVAIYGSLAYIENKELYEMEEYPKIRLNNQLFQVIRMFYEYYFLYDHDHFTIKLIFYGIEKDVICLIDEIFTKYNHSLEQKLGFGENEISSEKYDKYVLNDKTLLKCEAILVNFKHMEMKYGSIVLDLSFFDKNHKELFDSLKTKKGETRKKNSKDHFTPEKKVDVKDVENFVMMHYEKNQTQKTNMELDLKKDSKHKGKKENKKGKISKKDPINVKDHSLRDSSPVVGEESLVLDEKEQSRLAYQFLLEVEPYKALLLKERIFSEEDSSSTKKIPEQTSVPLKKKDIKTRSVVYKPTNDEGTRSGTNEYKNFNATVNYPNNKINNRLKTRSTNFRKPTYVNEDFADMNLNSEDNLKIEREYVKEIENLMNNSGKGLEMLGSPFLATYSKIIPKEINNVCAMLSSPTLIVHNIKSMSQVNFPFQCNRAKKAMYEYFCSYLMDFSGGLNIYPLQGLSFRSIIIDGANVCARSVHNKRKFDEKNIEYNYKNFKNYDYYNTQSGFESIIFDCSFLHEAYLFFKKRNVNDIVIVLNPITKKGDEYYLGTKRVLNYSYLKDLIKLNVIMISHDKYYNRYNGDFLKIRTYDDILMLQIAHHRRGCIISNDNFSDIKQYSTSEEIKTVIKHFVVKHCYDYEKKFHLEVRNKPLKEILNALFTEE